MSDLCRYCGLPGSDTVTHSYWTATKFPCHSACKKSGEKQEAYECQLIDADCNDCGYFRQTHNHGKGVRSGICTKVSPPSPTMAYSNKATGHGCFVHRRDM